MDTVSCIHRMVAYAGRKSAMDKRLIFASVLVVLANAAPR